MFTLVEEYAIGLFSSSESTKLKNNNLINWKSSSKCFTTDWKELKKITATIATPRPNAVAINAEPIPEATVAAWFPASAKMLNVNKILTTVPNKPKNGATPPIVPKIVK